MGNEMGNNNVSGIKEEEKAAVEIPEKEQIIDPADEVRGENHVIPEAQSKELHAKGEELSSNVLSARNDSDAERHEPNEKEIGAEESKPRSQSPEASTESSNSISQGSDIQKSASPGEGNNEKPVESNLEENMSSSDILQIHDQTSIEKETDIKVVERSVSTNSKTTFRPSKTSNQSTRSLEDSQCLPSNLSEEVPKMSETCNSEERENAQKDINREENIDDLVSEESRITVDELLESNTNTEKCDTKSTEDKFGNSLENPGAGKVPLGMNSSELSDSSTEAVLHYSSLDPSVATPEPQQKRVIHAEEIDLTSSKLEKREKNQDSNEINSSEQTVHELIVNNSAPSAILHDTLLKENGEVMIQLSSNSGLKKVHHSGEVKVTHKRSKSLLVGNRCVSIEQIEITEEVIRMLPTITSTRLSSTYKYDKEERETRKTSLEETEKTKDVSSSRQMNNDDRRTTEECSESFKWESSLLPTSPAPLGSQAAEDRKKFTIDFQDIFINATSNLDAHKATMQTPASSSSLETFKPEPAINVRANSVTSTETEVLSDQSNEQSATGEMTHLPNDKAQESSARISIESNPGHPGNLQRSKSPSFDFGLPLDARSEDSDQTPLLHHDKTAARSFSGFANVRFQNRIVQTDYGRKSLDFEPVADEEKTIRMERSDSDISRASFMNMLKKDHEKVNAQFTQQKQESPAANKKSEESSTEEPALTSLKGNGKRKNRASFFTFCICCATDIH